MRSSVLMLFALQVQSKRMQEGVLDDALVLEDTFDSATNNTMPALQVAHFLTDDASVQGDIAAAQARFAEADHESDPSLLKISPPLANIHIKSPADLLKKPQLMTDGNAVLTTLLDSAVRAYKTKNAVGERAYNDVAVHGKFEYWTLSDYVFQTYEQYGMQVSALAGDLLQYVGEQPVVSIYATTCSSWLRMAQATWKLAGRIATFYDTLGPDSVLFGLEAVQSKVLAVDCWSLVKLAEKLDEKHNDLKIIIMGPPIQEVETTKKGALDKLKALVGPDNIHILHESRLKSITGATISEGSPPTRSPPVAEDVAVIMFTSGTTGNPKGVQLTHENIVAAVAGFEQLARDDYRLSVVTYAAFLPLAHIMEMIAELSVLTMGGTLGYANPKSLLTPEYIGDRGQRKPKTPTMLAEGSVGDLEKLKPTFLVLPPTILERIFKAFEAQLNAIKRDGGCTGGILTFALAKAPVKTTVLAGTKIKNKLGGNVELIVTGSAPIDVEKATAVAQAASGFSGLFNYFVPIRQGYGLTENCACATAGWKQLEDIGSIGGPTQSTLVRLVDWPEGRYHFDDHLTAGMHRGEILVGGPTVTKGYLISDSFAEAEVQKIGYANEHEIVEIGGYRYFRTGDVGAVNPTTGEMFIVDRKKDLWKSQNGEYVALQQVEINIEKCLEPMSHFQVTFAWGGPDMLNPVALLVMTQQGISHYKLKEVEVSGKPYNVLADEEGKVIQSMVAKLNKCVEFAAHKFWIPSNIQLLPTNSISPEGISEKNIPPMMTASGKMQRAKIAGFYQDMLQQLAGRQG